MVRTQDLVRAGVLPQRWIRLEQVLCSSGEFAWAGFRAWAEFGTRAEVCSSGNLDRARAWIESLQRRWYHHEIPLNYHVVVHYWNIVQLEPAWVINRLSRIPVETRVAREYLGRIHAPMHRPQFTSAAAVLLPVATHIVGFVIGVAWQCLPCWINLFHSFLSCSGF